MLFRALAPSAYSGPENLQFHAVFNWLQVSWLLTSPLVTHDMGSKDGGNSIWAGCVITSYSIHYTKLYDRLKHRLVDLGATGALMSGSGPTVFGVFKSEAAARSAAADLERNPEWRVFVAQPV